MALTSIGGSGLDIKAIVAALVGADTAATKNRLDKQESNFTSQISALGMVKSSLSKLQSSLSKLSDISQLYQFKSSISDESIISATLSNEATISSYQIEVQQLATRQNLASAPFANSTTTVGSGSITIDFGTYSANNTVFTANPDKSPVTINITPGTDSLAAIRDAINNSGAGVQASIVEDSQGSRLTLLSPDTGKAMAMRITIADGDGNNSDSSGLSALAYDPTSAITSLTETVAATDSAVKINGLLLTQSNNQLTDAITGVSINLKKAQPGTVVNFSIDKNKSGLTNLVNDFIKQYNDTMTTINSLTAYNETTKKGGPMQSDAGIRSLKFNLSKIMGQLVGSSTNSIRSLGDIGIKTNDKGLLVMDETKFNAALDNHYEEVGTLFAKTATATDGNVRIKTVGTNVKAGLYNLQLDTYFPGGSLSGTIGGVTATSSDGFTLAGTGDFRGLSLSILAGSTGQRGQIQVTDGLAVQLNDLLNTYLDEKGELSVRTAQLNKRLERLDGDRQQLDFQAEMLTKRYTKQFSALDALLVKMQGVSDFLSQQLSNISQINRK